LQVKTRSVGECVQFYYLWKKTERFDYFATKARLEKKKYSMNPCVTDFMDKYLEDYDGGARDRSVSPNVNSLLQTDMKRASRSSELNDKTLHDGGGGGGGGEKVADSKNE